MLVKALRLPPSVLVFLVFCALFGWHLSAGTGFGDPLEPQAPAPEPENAGEPEAHEEPPASPPDPPSPPPPPPPPPQPQEPEEAQKPQESKSPRIAIVTFITDQKSYIHLSLKNKDHYARRHGYDLIVDYESHAEQGTTYWKFDMMERLIKKGDWDWLWWMDFDTLITNTDTKVLDIIDDTLANATKAEDIDFLVTHDCNGLNTGSFIVRSHDRSIKFLHSVNDIQKKEKEADNNLSEQDAMAALIKADQASAARTIKVPQWKLNAFPEEISCFDESKKVWEHGTFVLHFAGAWAHVQGDDPTGQLMNKYEPEIIWGDWKELY